MLRYLGVTAVKQKGAMMNRPFSPDPPVVPEDMRLVAIRRNRSWEVAPDVTHPADYSELVKAYQEGQFDECDLYLLDETLVLECPNEGRHFLS